MHNFYIGKCSYQAWNMTVIVHSFDVFELVILPFDLGTFRIEIFHKFWYICDFTFRIGLLFSFAIVRRLNRFFLYLYLLNLQFIDQEWIHICLN